MCIHHLARETFRAPVIARAVVNTHQPVIHSLSAYEQLPQQRQELLASPGAQPGVELRLEAGGAGKHALSLPASGPASTPLPAMSQGTVFLWASECMCPQSAMAFHNSA
jgi:hypothetical protein